MNGTLYTIPHDGLDRRVWVRTPTGYNPNANKRYPMLVVLHGGGSNPGAMQANCALDPIADEKGFITVYPEGTGPHPTMKVWNGGKCCGSAVTENVDDVGYIKKLIGLVQFKYKCLSYRIYLTGHSNGAILAHRVAAEQADLIAGVAPVSGGIEVEGLTPSRPVPVLEFHALNDPKFPFQGGVGDGPSGVDHTSIPDTIAFWTAANGCGVATTVDHGTHLVMTYPGTAPVTLYTLKTSGHPWPKTPIDASRLIMEWFDSP